MKPNGLPKNCLLRKSREFNQVYRSGRRLRGEGFAVIYMPNKQQQNRLGISVQRKVGNAVRRNRVKRIIREVFRLNRERFPSHADIVITVRPEFSVKSATEFLRKITAVMDSQLVAETSR